MSDAIPSSTVENYLKAIYLGLLGLEDSQRLLPMGQVAAALGVAPSSATMMAKTLSSSGLVEYEPHVGVALTAEGKRVAASIVRRHRLIELFLVKVMGLGWDEVHGHAERLEHAVADRLIDRMDEMLGHPEFDPHGAPIPDREGQVKPQKAESLMTCRLKTPLRVVRVADDQDGAFLRFLEANNLKPGELIEVEVRDDASDSVRLKRQDGGHLTIGTRAASKLLVRTDATTT